MGTLTDARDTRELAEQNRAIARRSDGASLRQQVTFGLQQLAGFGLATRLRAILDSEKDKLPSYMRDAFVDVLAALETAQHAIDQWNIDARSRAD